MVPFPSEIYSKLAVGFDTIQHDHCFHLNLVFHLAVLMISVISTARANGSSGSSIHLQAPHLASQYQEGRPSVYLSTTHPRSQIKPMKSKNINISNPCHGSAVKTNGTTCGLKEIMIGRCLEYQYVKSGFFLSNRT